MAVDPTSESIQRLVANASTPGPIVMLNLLRFADRATYEQYMRATAPFLAKVGGEVVYAGIGEEPVIGDGWDAVLLVRYPSRTAFMMMVADPDYREVSKLRTRSLKEAVLQPTTPWL